MINVDPTKTYYVYFDDAFATNTDDGSLYTGGITWDIDVATISGTSPQFKVDISA